MNRQQRRKAQRSPDTMTRQQLVHNLVKHGITPQDLETNYNIGFHEGWKSAKFYYLNICYAAAVRTLHRNADVSPAQCAEFLKEMDAMIFGEVDKEDAVAAAFAEAGVEFDIQEALPADRITEAGVA